MTKVEVKASTSMRDSYPAGVHTAYYRPEDIPEWATAVAWAYCEDGSVVEFKRTLRAAKMAYNRHSKTAWATHYGWAVLDKRETDVIGLLVYLC